MKEEMYDTISRIVIVYFCLTFWVGVLWLIGINQDWGDNVNALIKNTLIIFISIIIVNVALYYLVINLIISRVASVIIQMWIVIFQIVWFIHCYDIFYRESYDCKEKSLPLYWAHWLITYAADFTFFVCFLFY